MLTLCVSGKEVYDILYPSIMLASSHLKFCNRALLHLKNMKIKPLVCGSHAIIFGQIPVFGALDVQRHLTTSMMLHGKTRKMIKNKNIKKGKEAPDSGDSEEDLIKKYKNPLNSSYIGKYSKQKTNPKFDVWYNMSLKDLAEQTGKDLDKLFDTVLNLKNIDTDYIQSETQPLNNRELLQRIAKELHYKNNFIADPNKEKKEKVIIDKDAKSSPPPEEKDLIPRPPVVTIMGHIDHGKTSLLDFLRKSRIVAGEAGGITQHIGAFSVQLETGETVTFIDTPGHAAFTAMRTRGATSTDIVILIIDACEGVLEQTKESLRIIRQTRVPFIVALNKIDKPAANVDATKQQLESEGVVLEEKGGDVQCVEISALHGTNVKQLVEAVLTQAELMELKCDIKGKAEGVVIESQVEQGLGKTATVLVQRGVLKPGSSLVAGASWCKVRMLLDDRGERLKELKPSQAAKVVGWKDLVPSAGTDVLAVENEGRAKEVIAYRNTMAMKEYAEAQIDAIEDYREQARDEYLKFRHFKQATGWYRPKYGRLGLTRSKETEAESEDPVVAVVIKGDVDGSVEAILSCLETYHEDDVKLEIVHFGVGEVTETDVSMAESFNGIIYAFNASVTPQIQKLADKSGVAVRPYSVIYHLIADLKQEINSKMAPVSVEDIVGRANVLKEFLIKDKKNQLSVAGCRVISGKIPRIGTVKVVRGQDTLYLGELASLKHHKDEVSEIVQNQEGGLRVTDSELRFEEGDTVLAIEMREERNTTNWNPGF